MLSLHSQILNSAQINQNLTLAQVATPIPISPSHQVPLEFWGTIAILGVSAITLFRQEIQRFDKRREAEAEQAIAYVNELKSQNSNLEQEVRSLRNQVMGLRVRLAAAEKEVEISSGELRRHGEGIIK